MAQPRLSVRNYPDNAQLAIGATPTIIQQSRVTFTGQRGVAIVLWKLGVTKQSAGALAVVSTGVNGSSPVFDVATGLGHMAGAIGDQMGLWAIMVVQDPPENGFVELNAFTTTGAFDVQANSSTVQVMSFEAGQGAGPTVVLG